LTSHSKTEEPGAAEQRLAEMVSIQQRVCERYRSPFVPAPAYLKVGIADNVRISGLKPLNGLRHPPQGDTTGWYLWAGEKFGTDPDFFRPLHVIHLLDECPIALKYLGLGPGWRFLVDDRYEDVWYDAALLKV
jgi:hypothetical protein